MKGSHLRNLFIVLALLLALSAKLAQAQAPVVEQDQPQGGNGVTATLADAIPIQGRLTDASGAPLSGDHSVTFAIYDDPAAGNLICSTNYDPLNMTSGLFSITVTGCNDLLIAGQQLYLGVQIDDDAEMTPRQPIYAVPYARSLRPGADISGEVSGTSALALYNSSTTNGTKGLYAAATGDTGFTLGVEGVSDSPDGFGGYFINFATDGEGLFASGGGGDTADLVLGGIASGGNDDDGRIISDPTLTGSDLFLVSNDAIVLDLDNDQNDDGDLEVRNGSNLTILKASENGNVHLGINAGEATAISVGDRYRDNAIVAWAKINGGDPGSIQAEYGISSLDHYMTGAYKIYVDVSAEDAAALIAIAIAEIDTAPTGAGDLRIVSINQLEPNIFNVYINDGNGNLVNNDFVFMVTAR